MLTLYYRVPLNGVGRVGNHRRAWQIDRVDFPPLEHGAPAPEPELVKSCRSAMVDEQGKPPAMEALQAHDLREGLRAAFRAIDAEGGAQSSTTKPNGVPA